jgi:hypothetical protein
MLIRSQVPREEGHGPPLFYSAATAIGTASTARLLGYSPRHEHDHRLRATR